MPPNAAFNEGIGGGGEAMDYSSALEGEAAVKVVKGSQFKMEDFRAVKALGSGDMGKVYLVAQRSDNAPYAMKVMRKDVLRARKNEHRAKAEKDILCSVKHPFLPVLYSHFEDEKHLYLVMNYCHAGDLNVLRHKQSEKRFSENACRFYIAEVVLALEYLHKRNIVYRDLKPENILIRPDGHIMLTDFDLSVDLSGRKWTKPSVQSKAPSSVREKKASTAFQMTSLFACGSPAALSKKPSKKSPNARIQPEEMYSSRRGGYRALQPVDGPTNSFVGTEEYVAPEIVWGKGHGLPVDWWTLGILLFELFYGKTPFKGSNRKETFYSILCKPATFPVPSPLTDLISKLLAKEPENRLGTKGGADEVKKHPFFAGLNWDELEYMSRTPIVPEPFSWEQLEEDMRAKAKATGKEAQTKWSFSERVESLVDEKRDENGDTAKPSGRLSLNSSDLTACQDSLSETVIDNSIVAVDSTPVSPPQDHSTSEDCSSQDTFSLDSQPDIDNQLTSTTPKEEVRLVPADDVLIGLTLFGGFF